MTKFKIVTIVLVVFSLITLLVLGDKVAETNEAGQFQVKRAFITGEISVKDDAGLYGQWFGRIFTYNNVATVGFGREKGEGTADIDAIPVIFNDGSMATNSGLVRIKLPGIGMRKPLLNEYSRGYEHFITSGVLPVVRNAVKLSANLRSAQDAYTTLALYQQAIQDQIENGTYVTYAAVDTIINATGDTETRQVTKIRVDGNGLPLRNPNRLQELGCEVLECVIDVPEFDEAVKNSIAKRKDEAMATELSKQEALRAKQQTITAIEQGKKNVATAEYEENVEKVKAVTIAQKEFEVAELDAKKALENKKALIAKGQGEAEAARLKVSAGLTPQERAEWEYKTATGVAKEIFGGKGVNFPDILITGGDGGKGGQPIDPFTAVGLESLKKMVNSNNGTTSK